MAAFASCSTEPAVTDNSKTPEARFLEAQLKNHPETDMEITSSTLKFFFPIDGMPKGMVAHAPEDDILNEPWIKDLRDFVRNTCQLNGLMTNAKDLGNIRYTLPVRVVLEKLDVFKGK